MPFPDGPWSSYLNTAPASLPNDGVFFINPPNASGDFTGTHHRSPFSNTAIEGHFTEATASTLAHIRFTERVNTTTFTYDADVIEFKPTFFVTLRGFRNAAGTPATTVDDEWVGTHTT